MYISQRWIRMNKMSFAIILFLIFFSIFHYIKPAFAYGPQGNFRPFGLGYRHKTVIPIWLVAIILAIFCYLFVLSI